MANFDGLSSLALKEMNRSVDGSGISAYSKRLFDDALTWDDIKWLKSITHLPVIAKGILTGGDNFDRVWIHSHWILPALVDVFLRYRRPERVRSRL